MMKSLRLPLFGLALLIAGCAQFTLQKPGKVTVAGNMTVNTASEWSRLASGSRETWTVDGVSLQELVFIADIGDGQEILQRTGEEKLPKFRAGMTSFEVAETIQASFAVKSLRNFKMTGLRPIRLGNRDGFRFEFNYTTKIGLEKVGFVVGAEHDKKLTLIIYSGARLHYHDKMKDEVDRVVDSVRFL